DRRRAEVAVRDVLPVRAAVGRFPHAARDTAKVEHHRLCGMPGDGHDPAAPGRTDAAPTETLEPRWIHRLDLVPEGCRVRPSEDPRQDAVADDRPGPWGAAIAPHRAAHPTFRLTPPSPTATLARSGSTQAQCTRRLPWKRSSPSARESSWGWSSRISPRAAS